ncbi:hypothetical protein HYU10_01330 [Candidatus Woesearchaeota archaeon]|nr:hypothetical protein [Candidatus Woesearchaeota archaeon]
MQNKLIFSDIDGTLVFSYKLPDSYEPVEDFYDTHGVGFYTPELSRLVNEIRERNSFHLVTGRAFQSFLNVRDILPYDSAGLENGCIITDREGNVDREWYDENIREVAGDLDDNGNPQRDPSRQLWDFDGYLGALGFTTEHLGRFASVRIRAENNGGIPPEDLSGRLMDAYWMKSDVFPDLVMAVHDGTVDFHPSRGGKGNYMRHIAEKEGRQIRLGPAGSVTCISDTVAIGNDPNDLPMLRVAEVPITLASARSEIIDYVVSKPGGIVAGGVLYRGSRQMLEFILE